MHCYSFSASGNTPAHCASSGHMQAMNCLVVHNSNMSLTNTMGDSPEMLSRKYGNTIGYEKAGTISDLWWIELTLCCFARRCTHNMYPEFTVVLLIL